MTTTKQRTYGTGSITQDSPGHWSLRAYVGIDPVTGKQRRPHHPFTGTRKDATAELARLVAQAGV